MKPERNRLQCAEDAFAAIFTVGLTIGFVALTVSLWPDPAAGFKRGLARLHAPAVPSHVLVVSQRLAASYISLAEAAEENSAADIAAEFGSPVRLKEEE